MPSKGMPSKMMKMMNMMTLVDAAHRLAVPWHTAHRYALTGRLEAKKVGGRWTVTSASVAKVAKELRAERSS